MALVVCMRHVVRWFDTLTVVTRIGLVEKLSNEKTELAAEITRLSSTLTSMEEGDSVLRGRLARTEEARLQLKEEVRGAFLLVAIVSMIGLVVTIRWWN